MSETYERISSEIDKTDLEGIAAQILESTPTELVDWRVEPMEGGFGGTVFRVVGKALCQDELRAWSAVLKIPRKTIGLGDPWGGVREPVVYRSRALEAIPGGLRTPRCYGVKDHTDHTTWIWLEDIEHDASAAWSSEQFKWAAYHLGQFNAHFADSRTLPSWTWLKTGYQLRDYVNRFAPPRDKLQDALDRLRQDYDFPVGICRRMIHFYADHDRVLAALEKLPKTLCHMDAEHRNLIPGLSSDGSRETVAIDWAFSGLGVLGEDIARLVGGALLYFQIDPRDAMDLDDMVFRAYLAGLQSMDWQGKAALVRFGYTSVAAIVYGLVLGGFLITHMVQDEGRAAYERVFGRDAAEIVRMVQGLVGFELDRADEALSMMPNMDLAE